MIGVSILGIIQGVTEFLPVSSSGHLVIFKNLLCSLKTGVFLEIVLHFATLLSVILFFRKRIFNLCQGVFRYLNGKRSKTEVESIKLIFYLFIGSIPAGIAGIFLKKHIEILFNKPVFAAICLLITGLLLIFTVKLKEKNESLTLKVALLIGLAQAVAILPGISRSGSTIAIALFLGLSADSAYEFSFLLMIPAVLGATLLEVKHYFSLFYAGSVHMFSFQTISVLAGFLFAFVFGILALRFLKDVVVKGRLYYFGIYCIVISIISFFIVGGY